MASRRQADQLEAAAALRHLLEAVERGDIDASTGSERRMVRRLEGAVAALEVSARPSRR